MGGTTGIQGLIYTWVNEMSVISVSVFSGGSLLSNGSIDQQ